MSNSYLNQIIRRVIYALKREYGNSITIYVLGTSTRDVETGILTETHTSYEIARAPVLPAKVMPEVVKNISMISANKKFAFGGYFDTSTRLFLIDRRDVPDISELTNHDWIIYRDKRFDITNFFELEYSTSWMVTAKAQEGLVPPQDRRVIAEDTQTFTDTAELHEPRAFGADTQTFMDTAAAVIV